MALLKEGNVARKLHTITKVCKDLHLSQSVPLGPTEFLNAHLEHVIETRGKPDTPAECLVIIAEASDGEIGTRFRSNHGFDHQALQCKSPISLFIKSRRYVRDFEACRGAVFIWAGPKQRVRGRDSAIDV